MTDTPTRCWICGRWLVAYTDGEGRVHEGCPPCRADIEALRAKVQRLNRPLPPAPRKDRRCPRCLQRPVFSRARVCATCRAAEVAALKASRARAREALQRARQEAARARQEASRAAHSFTCRRCGAAFEHRSGGRPKDCPSCKVLVVRGSDEGRRRGAAVSATRRALEGARKRGELQALEAAHPKWSATQFARRLGVSAQRVYQMRLEIKAGKPVARDGRVWAVA